MNEKYVLITGATNGIGAVAAKELARQGCRVTLVGRSQARCDDTVEEIRKETGNVHVDSLVADLSKKSEVERLAAAVKERMPRLDVLVNNAGALFLDRRETEDGLERTFALNHMAYFTLTAHLLDLLKKSAPARVVNVSSRAHTGGEMNFDDLQMKKQFSGTGAYANSKLANVLFTTELARRLEGTGVTANALHPGVVATNFGADNGWKTWFISVAFRVFGVTAEQGARTIVYLASSPDVAGTTGRYFYKERESDVSKAAADAKSAQRLWEVSAQLAGLPA